MTPRLEGALWGTLYGLLVKVNNRRIESEEKKEGEGNEEKKVSEEEEEERVRLPTPKGNSCNEWKRRNKGFFLSSEGLPAAKHREIPTN